MSFKMEEMDDTTFFFLNESYISPFVFKHRNMCLSDYVSTRDISFQDLDFNETVHKVV